jgi:hypothetical protein
VMIASTWRMVLSIEIEMPEVSQVCATKRVYDSAAMVQVCKQWTRVVVMETCGRNRGVVVMEACGRSGGVVVMEACGRNGGVVVASIYPTGETASMCLIDMFMNTLPCHTPTYACL